MGQARFDRSSYCSLVMLGLIYSTTSHADSAAGQHWLYVQAKSPSSQALDLQSYDESLRALSLLQAGTLPQIDIDALLDGDHSTEALIRAAAITHRQQQALSYTSGYLTQVLAHQNTDGGFGHLSGWQSNPLDTAYVLLTLSDTQFVSQLTAPNEIARWNAAIEQAIQYLLSQQRSNGAYQMVSMDQLYVSAHVLSALTPYAKTHPQTVASIQRLVDFLHTAQVAPAQWSRHPQGLFLDALVAEALHPYHKASEQSIETAFKSRVDALQQSDGSWQSDAYVTALVLRSVKRQSVATVNPIAASLKVTAIDAITNFPLPDVTLTITADSGEQIANISSIDGVIDLQNILPGKYQFVLARDGYAPLKFSMSLKYGEYLDLGKLKINQFTNANIPQVQGRVFDDLTGQSVSGATVTVVMVDSQGLPLADQAPLVAVTDINGNYQIILKKEGFFGIDIRKNGFSVQNGSGTVRKGEVLLFNAKLRSLTGFSGNVSGQIFDKNGLPVVSAEIRSGSTVLGVTDAQGSFQVFITDRDQKTLTIHKDGYTDFGLKAFVSNGEVFNSGAISLSDKNSNPVANTGVVRLNVKDQHTQESVDLFEVIAERLDANGNVVQTQRIRKTGNPSEQFLEIGLPEGQWTLHINSPAYQEVIKNVNIQSNTNQEIGISLVIKPYAFTAKFVDSQTGLALSNVDITIVDQNDKATIWQGRTDNNGIVLSGANLTASNIQLDIQAAGYDLVHRYTNRQFQNASTLDAGVIYIGKTSDDAFLPDLIINKIDDTKLFFDNQSMNTSGILNVDIENAGVDSTSQTFKLIAFYDLNKNGIKDSSEDTIGTSLISEPLLKNKKSSLSMNIKGGAPFKEAPITVVIDSDLSVPEQRENNNIRLSSQDRISHEIGQIDPYVAYKWKYLANGQTTYFSIAPMSDTNKDGKIGAGDRPLVIVTDRDFKGGRCCVTIKGIDFHDKKSNIAYETVVLGHPDSVVIADLNQDNSPELVTYDADWGPNSDVGLPISDNDYKGDVFRFFDSNGNFIKKIRPPAGALSGQLTIADINHNGRPAVMSDFVYDAGYPDYRTVKTYADISKNIGEKYFRTSGFYVPELDDLNWMWEGGFMTSATVAAVTDFNKDGIPDVFQVNNYGIYMNDYREQVSKLDFGGGGGSYGRLGFILDDISGDDKLELVIAKQDQSINAYDSSGKLLWNIDKSNFQGDFSPGYYDGIASAGITAFDLDGDGVKEIITANDKVLSIIDSQTGIFKCRLLTGALIDGSGVQQWSRIKVADVDADGHADIIMSTGLEVLVFSSVSGTWANARNIWNQENYHITNVNDDLTIPQYDRPWETVNSYGVQQNLGTPAQNRADLTTSFIQVTDNGWLSDSTLKARVGNAGGKSVPAGTPVSFYRIPPAINGVTQAPILLQVATLSKTLEAGDYEDIALTYAGSLAGFGELVVVANDAGAGIDSLTGIIAGQTQSAVIQEFTRSNNMARLSIGGGFQSYTLSGSLDQPTYQVAQNVQITAQATNLGSFDADATVRMTVLDQVGNVLAVLPTQSVTLLAGSNQRVSVRNTWNTGNQRAGAYHVRIELIRPSLLGNADVVAQAEQNFNIGVDAAVAGLTDARLFADKATYSSGDVVQATLQLRNTASNQVAGPRTTTVSLQSPTGEIIWTQQTHVDQLSPNRLNEQSWRIALNQAVAGQYILRSTTHADDGIQPDQVRSQALTVLSNAATLVGVSGTLTSSLTQANVGDAVHFQWSVRNQGAALDQLPARIVLINTNTGQRVGPTIYQGNITLAKQSTLSPQTTAWLSSIEPAQLDQPLMAMLQVQLQNGLSGEDQWRGLAQQPIKITQPPLKIEIGVDGEDGVQGKANGAPLLVYYNCHEGWDTLVTHWSAGIFVDQCFTQRAAQIKPYLDRLNIPYTLVKSPWDFKAQLRSGVYGQYWMLGAVEQLQPDSVYELRETAHLGDGLLVDSGMHSWSNEHLFMLAGADPKGRLRLTDGVITPQTIASNSTVPPLLRTPNDTNVAAAVLKTMTPRRGQPYAHNWPTLLEPLTPYTQIAATFDGRQRLDVWFAALQGKPASSLPQVQYPAITTAPYGRGYPVGVAFDLISTLQNASLSTAQPNYAQQRWDQVLADFSRPRRSTAKIAYAPAEPIRIPVRLNNQSNSSRIIKVVVDLPSGSTWLGHMGGLTTTQNGQIEQQTSATQVSFTVTLAAQAKQTELLTLRLPKTAGTAVVRTSLYPVQNGVAGVALAQQESRFIIRSIDEHLNLLNQTIGRWNSIGTNGVAVTLLKVKLKLIETHLKLGLTELALDETSRMGNTLASMTTTPTQDIMKVRLETDELMKALEIKWYLECADKKPK